MVFKFKIFMHEKKIFSEVFWADQLVRRIMRNPACMKHFRNYGAWNYCCATIAWHGVFFDRKIILIDIEFRNAEGGKSEMTQFRAGILEVLILLHFRVNWPINWSLQFTSKWLYKAKLKSAKRSFAKNI